MPPRSTTVGQEVHRAAQRFERLAYVSTAYVAGMRLRILGILAAFAVPRFASLEGQARLASTQALAGSVRSGAALAHALWLAQGDPASASVTMEGQPIAMAFGYPDAAAIEAVASNGRQIVPPVMGAAAFLMAEFLNIPYGQIALAAAIVVGIVAAMGVLLGAGFALTTSTRAPCARTAAIASAAPGIATVAGITSASYRDR